MNDIEWSARLKKDEKWIEMDGWMVIEQDGLMVGRAALWVSEREWTKKLGIFAMSFHPIYISAAHSDMRSWGWMMSSLSSPPQSSAAASTFCMRLRISYKKFTLTPSFWATMFLCTVHTVGLEFNWQQQRGLCVNRTFSDNDSDLCQCSGMIFPRFHCMSWLCRERVNEFEVLKIVLHNSNPQFTSMNNSNWRERFTFH